MDLATRTETSGKSKSKTKSTTKSTTTNAGAHLRLPVSGMTCGSCVRRVETGLERLEGTGEIAVNLAGEHVDIAYDPAQASMSISPMIPPAWRRMTSSRRWKPPVTT